MLFVLSILIVIVCVSTLLVVDYLKKRRFSERIGNVEFRSNLPILGSIPAVLKTGVRRYIYEWTTRSSKPSLIWIFSRPFYYTQDPEELQSILSSKSALSKGTPYKFVNILRESILACDVHIWRDHRRLLNRCFNQKQIFSFVSLFNEFADHLASKLLPEMTIKDFRRVSEKNFLNNFFASLGNSGTKDFNSYLMFDMYSVIKQLEPNLMKRFFRPWLYLDFVFYRTKSGKIFKEETDKIDNNFKNIIETRSKTTEECGDSDKSLKYDFMDILLNKYEPNEMRSEMILFTAASTETTGSTFAAVILVLAMHQDVQERVYQEIVSVTDTDSAVKTDHLPQLKYTQMVINEALRLFPAAVYILRKTDNDIDLGNNRCIPKGTDILINMKQLHRSPELWKDPLKFMPERFSPEEVEKRHPCSFIPFSYGLRNCIGAKYAEIVLKINLAKIVLNYRITTDCKNVEDIAVPEAVLLQLPENIQLKFEQRNI